VENIDYLAPLGKSDHSVLMIHANMPNNRNVPAKLNLNKGSYIALRD